MSFKLERFGSIFVYGDKREYFVYLGYDPEMERLYAAKILDEERSKLLQKTSDKYESRPQSLIREALFLCFVPLTTEEFKERVASFHRTGENVDFSNGLSFLDKTLNDKDTSELKKMILEDGAIPEGLKTIVRILEGK